MGTDTDLLVLLVALAPQSEATIFILKPSSSESACKVYYVDFLVHKYLDQRTILIFAHSLTGCDTTSAFCGLGKLEAADLISKSTEAKSQVELFTKPEITKESLQENGKRFILSMYGLSRFKDLDEARYFKFKQLSTAKYLLSPPST